MLRLSDDPAGTAVNFLIVVACGVAAFAIVIIAAIGCCIYELARQVRHWWRRRPLSAADVRWMAEAGAQHRWEQAQIDEHAAGRQHFARIEDLFFRGGR